ncbi:glucose 1-dehydrogenase [Actinomadura viridis]|uniref:NAD(P)-dependent dehydrogenase (Short-subunit alcohol dehydrogenase family) n=1 Tax=Actinomadura viridis TaxID=58110 RepID=A0A931DIP2_9ACTN|nr:SDR family oxidoreductase [Actinomadura viridis]MBG6087443.1 NAD(P)-dependent dehydrogenase (short-subunit alcohol dehydrogenase family) [Actinomadura viridis]
MRGKTVLITGGGTGIGRATALAFAREGATVVVSGRTPGPLADTVKLIETDGGKADHIPADVAKAADVRHLITTTVERHGGLDVAVNNAGAFSAAPIAEMDEDAWDALLATNLTGTFLPMKYEIAHMSAHGGGTIVNVSSNIGAHQRLPGTGAYAATKAAVSSLTRTAARESIGQGVRINAVSPGPVETSMSLFPGEDEADRAERLSTALPIGRAGTVEEIAASILWLAGPESSFVVGHDLVIDGAATA